MRKFGLLGTSALGSFTFIGLSIALAAPAYAQEVAEDDATEQGTVGEGETEIESGTEATPAAGETITVTGSRIRRPNLESAVPITSIGGEEFFQTSTISIGDVLNELPQLRNTFSQANSTRFLGTRGLNLLDLRGLGTQRTLVLVNGRRHVPGDVLNNATSPDTNTFPTDLIERVDVITGGGSSIYGSDAIAGTVNFILKDNFDGYQVRGQSGITQYGDGAARYVSALAGKNFAGDRGNVAINLEYATQDDFYASGRPALRQNNTFLVVDTDPAGAANGSDGNPDRVFFRDIRSATISVGGLVNFRQPVPPAGTNPPCGRDGLPANAAGNQFACTFLFDQNGNLAPQTGSRVGLGPNGNFIDGNGYSGRENRLIALMPNLERYSANLIGHFEISPAIVPFVEAKYVRADAQGSQSGPFFSQGQTLGDAICFDDYNDRSYLGNMTVVPTCDDGNTFTNREGIRIDNPFLSPGARATIAAQLANSISGGINPNTGAAMNAAARTVALAQLADGTYRFNLRKNFVELGIRDEIFKRETYRAVVGVRGDFWDDWNYEIAANYGEHRETNLIKGNINTQRFLYALDTAIHPVSGQIVCRSQIDPNYAPSYVTGAVDAISQADVAACVPLNPFGDGNSSQAVRDYITVDSRATGKITQFVASGFVAGDFSNFFELPGGPVAFSVGAEYRRETLVYDLDDLTQAGYAFYNAIPSFSGPAFEVKEAFAEISIPLLKDLPLFQELTLSGSGRVSDYKGGAGTVWTYGGEVTWRPIQDIRFRGSYNRAVRAPNLSELYSAQGQNFALINDPCSLNFIGTGSTTRAANCAAAGAPPGYNFLYSSSLSFVTGGNPDLNVESSDNYTVGFVLTPRFIPGLSVSVDWYDITVDDVIQTVGAQTIVNQCYDSPTLQNPFCDQFQRAGPSGGPKGEEPFRILEDSLFSGALNFAKMERRGVDTEVAYRKKFNWGTASFRGTWTHTIRNRDFLNPTNPNFANSYMRELADPQDEVNANLSLKAGKYTLGYQVRWIGEQYLNTYEDYNSINGNPPQNADYADIQTYPAVFYHDMRLGIDVTERFNFYMGIDNLFNRMPPFGLTGVGGGSGIYDNRGRNFYAGVVAKF
ncbi:MAG: TonB-dependent receptor domain-containing protein [Allosphingosinicella sp.]